MGSEEASSSKKVKLNLDKCEVDKIMIYDKSRVKLTSASKQYPSFKRVIIDEEETKFVVCINCNDDHLITYDKKLGTASMIKHLNSDKHMKGRNEDQNQTKFYEFLKKTVTNTDKSKVAEAAAVCCALDFRPFSMVEGQGMIKFVQTIINIASIRGRIDAAQLLPCHKTVKSHLTKIAMSIRTNLINNLSSIPYINATCDHWTDKFDGNSFMTVCIHYYDQEMNKIVNRNIATFGVENKCSKTTIGHFKEQLHKLDLMGKIRIIVTDNASNMKSAFKEGVWIGCSAHNMSLVHKHSFVFNDSDPSIKQLIDNCKLLVSSVKRGGINPHLQKRVVQECETRWDSICDMLISIKDNIEEFDKFPQLKQYTDSINIGLLQELITLLSELKSLRLTLCNDKTTTFNLVAITFDKVLKIAKSRIKDSVSIQALKNRYNVQLKQRFVVTSYHLIATFLTPCFRSFKFNDEALRTEAENTLGLMFEEVSESESEDEGSNRSDDDLFFEYRDKPKKSRDKSHEVDQYKCHSFTDTDLKINPLQFWSVNRVLYPKLSSIAFWLLAAPATSSSSERAFSFAGNCITPLRNRLDQETVNELSFVKSNIDMYH